MKNSELTGSMNRSIGRLSDTALRIALSDFSGAANLVKTLRHQKKAAQIRTGHEKRGLHVPPFVIASIVRACNLKCTGCYDKAKQECAPSAPELDAAAWARVFSEARNLGVSFMLLAGGEPLLKEAVIRACADYPEIVFPVFTNGLLVNEQWADFFVKARNIVPVVSIEGDEALTDERRGSGVYASLVKTLALLKRKKILYGTSITLTSANYDCVLSESYVRGLVDGGSRLFFFIEYVPFDAATDSLVVTSAQKALLPARLEALRSMFPAIFLDFPGDEAAFGGCLASGRGFLHINASGGVESCPFAPYSDTSLAHRSLSEALSSPMLAKIRTLQETLGHTGGCTLFENKDKVEALLAEKSAVKL